MRLGFWQKTTVLMTTTVVGASGLIWFVLHDVVEGEPGDLVRSLLTLHGVASYVLLVVVGSLLPLHVRSGWRHRRNLMTGVAVTGVMAILGATALMLYYGSEETRTLAKWAHLAVGLFCFVVFPAHVFLARKSHRESPLPAVRKQEMLRPVPAFSEISGSVVASAVPSPRGAMHEMQEFS